MVRRVFFSFHRTKTDISRVNVVRNHWVTKDREAAGYWDAAAWEELKKKGDDAIKRWIDKELKGTSVTAVLIGAKTSERKWVKYEIKKSHEDGKGLFGVYIHNIRDLNGQTGTKGKNPFDNFYIEKNGKKVYLSKIYPTYDWKNDKGYDNFADWVEKAAKKAGK